MSAKTVGPPALRPEIQEIAELADVITSWRDGGDTIGEIENQLLRFANLLDEVIGADTPPWEAAETSILGHAFVLLFELGYLQQRAWATFYAKSFIAYWKRGEK